MSDTHEEWKPIEEVKGIYSVSNQGRVMNNRTGYILKSVPFHRGYMKVNLKVDGKSISRQVHRLVAIAFIPNLDNKPEVNHKNGIHEDNRVENLEWVTGEENRKHAYETNLVRHKDDRYSGYLYSVWRRLYKSNMCSEWQDYLTFYDWCYCNGYAKGNVVCRYDTGSLYEPDNCYISSKIQHPTIPKEKRKRLFRCFDELLTIEELSKKYNIGSETFIYRLKKGMSIEEAATKPLSNKGRPRKEVL